MAGLGRPWSEEVLDEVLPWTAPQTRKRWQARQGAEVLNHGCTVKSSEELYNSSCAPNLLNQNLWVGQGAQTPNFFFFKASQVVSLCSTGWATSQVSKVARVPQNSTMLSQACVWADGQGNGHMKASGPLA